jgi:hypothetical protein
MFELEPRSESFIRSLLEGMLGKGCKGMGWGKLNCPFFIIPSLSVLHNGLCHQGQRPNRVEVTVLPVLTLALSLAHKNVLMNINSQNKERLFSSTALFN